MTDTIAAPLVPSGDACPHCRSTDLREFDAPAHDEKTPVRIHVHACNDCNFAWQWPWHRSATSSRDYFEQEYQAGSDGTYFDRENRMKIAGQQFDYVRSQVPGPASLLDIGGGDGVFGETVAAGGWPVTCIDPAMSPPANAGGNPRFIRGLLDDLPDAERFDVVTMWDVIEHLEAPVEVLAAAARRLAPGGRLFVETGNFQSAGRIESGGDWWCYQSDHRWYFTPSVIASMMAGAGLADIAVHDRVLRPWWSGDKASRAPSLCGTIKRSVKRPHRMLENFRRHRELAACARDWPEWSGLEIFAVSGRLPQ